MMSRGGSEIDRLIEQGLGLYGEGDLDGALLLWERALSMDPENAQANSYVDYVRMNYELLTNDVNTEHSGPFAIGEDDPDYQIEILPGEDVASGAAPLYMDAGNEGWPISDESGAHDRPTKEGLELELELEADPPPSAVSFETTTGEAVSFDSATREYPGGAGRPASALLGEGLPAPDVGDFEPDVTPPFGTVQDLSTPQDFGSQLTDVRRRDLGFVKPSAPVIATPVTARAPSATQPPAMSSAKTTELDPDAFGPGAFGASALEPRALDRTLDSSANDSSAHDSSAHDSSAHDPSIHRAASEPPELKMTLRTPSPTVPATPPPPDPHRAQTADGASDDDDLDPGITISTGNAATLDLGEPIPDGDSGSAYDSLDLELSVSSDPGISLDLVGRAETHEAKPGDSASMLLGASPLDGLFDDEEDDAAPAPAEAIEEPTVRKPSPNDPAATAARAAEIIAAAREARLAAAARGDDDDDDDEGHGHDHDPLDLLKTLPVPSKPRTLTTPTSPTRDLATPPRGVERDLEDRATREMPPGSRPAAMSPSSLSGSVAPGDLPYTIQLDPRLAQHADPNRPGLPRPHTASPQVTRDFSDLDQAAPPAAGRAPSRPGVQTIPALASGAVPVASSSSGIIPVSPPGPSPSGQFRAMQTIDPMISAPTRDLGLRVERRPPTEDEPTTELDAQKIRAATPPRRNGRPTLPGLDPIDARSAEILEEVDRGAPTNETREDRTRRRITALIERSTEWGRTGDLERAVTAVDLALSEDPNSALAQKLIHRNRDMIMTAFQNFLGDLQRTPALARPLHELASAPISPRAAFLLSRVDGTLSLDEILDVSGMPRLEAYRYLCQLFLRGILR